MDFSIEDGLMAKTKKPASKSNGVEATFEKIKTAAEFKSLDSPEVKKEIMAIIADHSGQPVPDEDD
jgi:hypothetical protein